VKKNILTIHQNKNTTTKLIVRTTKVIHVHHVAKTLTTMNNLDAMLRKLADSKFVSGLATISAKSIL